MDVNQERKVLMISYIFPPLGSGANQRTVRFVKYLSHFGWTPIVLTVRNGYYRFRDDYFLKIIPENVKIYRAFSLEQGRFEQFVRMVKSVLKSMINTLLGKKPRSDTSDYGTTPSVVINNNKSVYKYIYTGMISLYLYLLKIFSKYVLIPDEKVGWIPFALLKGLKIIYKERPSIIWANADRPSGLVVGVLLKMITGRKLVLNFSDPWILNPYYRFGRKSFRSRVESVLERLVIRGADRIVFANHSIQLDYEKVYQDDSSKFITVQNGYDPDEFDGMPSRSNYNKFILTYCGSLQFFHSPKPLFQALEGLLDKFPWLQSTLLIRFVGRIDSENLHYFESFNYKNILHLTGLVSYKEGMKYIFNSDVCIAFTGNEYTCEVPGKIFEYMAAKKPILIISQEGPAAELVEKLKVGVRVRPDNIKSIQSAILELMEKIDSQSYYKDKDKLIENYSRKSQTGELAACFDSLLTEKARKINKTLYNFLSC